MGFAGGLDPGRRVEFREGDVAVGGLVDLGEFEGVGVREGLAVDLAAAGDEQRAVATQRLFEGVRDVDAVRGPVGLPGDDDGPAARAAAGRSSRRSCGP